MKIATLSLKTIFTFMVPNFKIRSFSIIAFLFCLQFGYAQPGNDNFASATIVPHTPSWCSANAAYTTLNATADGVKGSAWSNGPNYNVWFKFQATTAQVNAQINIGGTAGSMRYPFMALWNSSGTEITSAIYYSSTSNINVQSNNLIVGNWYYISVDNYVGSGYQGTFSLCVDDTVNYDYKEAAITVPHTSSWCSADAAYSTLNATADGVKGSAWTNGPNYNRWFKFQATTTQVNAQVKIGGTAGSMRYPFAALWNSSGTEITSSIYYSSTSNINVQSNNLIVGNWYYISVDNYVGSGYQGTFSLCVDDTVNYDYKEAAITVPHTPNWCSADAAYNTWNATPDGVKGSNWTNGPNYNVWFKFQATTTEVNAQVNIGGTAGSMRYPFAALWNSSGTEISSAIYYSSTSNINVQSANLIVGNWYYISVDNYVGAGYQGTFSLCVDDKVNYDFYEGAMDVTSLMNSCSTDAIYDTRGGSPDKLIGSAWNGGPRYNRWFKFTAPATGEINITVQRGGTKGSQQYSQVALWQANGTTEVGSKRYISINDDVVMGAIGLTPGATYYISVDAYSGYYGTFTLCLQDTVDYDFYEGAIDVTSLMNSCSADAIYDTRGGSPDKLIGSAWNGGPRYNRWFKFTAPATGEINITVQRGGTKGSQQYSQVALWQANGTTEINSKRYISINDDVVMGAVGLTPGATYYISVDAYSGYYGTFTLCLQDTVDYDFYEGAIDVTSLMNSCSADAIYDIRGATPDKARGSNWNNNGPIFNRWFKFTAPATGEINITVDVGGAKGTQRTTQLALWQANGTTEVNSKIYVSVNDDVVMGATSLTPGATYYISVDAYPGSYYGTFTLCLQDTVDYDFYEGALDVTSLINSCSADAIYDTRGGTPDKARGSNWNNNGPLFNRWFKFTAPATGQINITVDVGGSKGNQRTTQLALWQANGTTEVKSKIYISVNDDVVMGATGLTPGATYYISVDAYPGSYYGTFTLCLQDNVDYDFYEGAIDVTSLMNSCSADAIYDTRGGTPDKARGSNWNNNGPLFNRWFKFTAPATGQINITVDVGGSKGNHSTTQLALWQANGTTEVNSKIYVSVNDDVVMGATGLTPGATYYISVDAYPGSYYGTFSLCLQDIYGLPNFGPGGVRQDLRLWLRGDIGTNTTIDGASMSAWNDQGKATNAISTTGQEPIFKNNANDNINYNAVLDFSGNKSMYGQFATGFFSQDVFAVVIPNEIINNATPKMTILSGETSPSSINDLSGIGFGNYTGAVSNEIITYAQGDDSSYRAAEVNTTKSYTNAVIVNARNNTLINGMELFQNANQVGNTIVGSGFSNIFGGKYWIGKNKSDTQGSLNGRVAEIITYSSLINSSDRSKIESYLAIKYGITLGVNGTSQNYVNSSGATIWDTSSNSGFNYDIAGIGRDNAAGSSQLSQKQSKSINTTDNVTIGLGTIKSSNSLNNYIFNVDKCFLLWGNNNAVLDKPDASTDRLITIGTGLQTYVKLTGKIWKIVETGGDLAEVTVSIPETILTNNFAKTSAEDYALVVSSSLGFETNNIMDVIPLKTVGSNLQTWYDFDGVKYFCFAKISKLENKLQLNSASGDYLLGENNMNLNTSFTMSAWIQNAAPGTTRTFIAKGTDYVMSLNSANRVEVSWNGGVKITSKASSTLTDLKWHHVAVTFSAGSAKLYIDGILDQTVNSLANPVASTAKFSIGGLYTNKGAISNYFMSNIDEVRIWDVALTPAQLQYLMNQEMEKFTDNTINGKILPQYTTNNEVKMLPWSNVKAYYDLNTLCGTAVEDKSNNNNFLRIKYLTPNKQVISLQTAPLPYTTISNGCLDTSSTYTNGTIWTFPNSLGMDGVTRVNWNIIETKHSVFNIRNTTLLGLIVDSNVLTVKGDNKMEVTHYLKLDGKMDLEGESQLIQGSGSYLDPTSSGTLERDQQGTADTYTYNYWCSPVGVSNSTTNNNSYTLPDVITNVGFLTSGYNGSSSPVKNADYWIWKYSNLTYDNYSAWQHVRSTGTLATGEGFTMKGPGTATADQNYILEGKPNNGDFSLKLGVGNEYLVGNPYPSAMDADEFIKDNIGNTETNGRNPAGNVINGAIYFWDHFANNTHVLAEYEGGYATYTLMGGAVAISNDTRIKSSGKIGTKIPGRYIPVGQGFFVNAILDLDLAAAPNNPALISPVVGGDILFKNSQRVFVTEASASSTFMKSSNLKNKTAASQNEILDTRQKIRLNMDSPKGYHRQLLVGADENASNNFDIGYDAPLIEDNKEDMFWIFNDANFIIQAVNNFDGDQKLPLGIKINKAGLATLKIDALENIDNNQEIYLHDKELNVYHNLKESAYEVYLSVGKHLARFEITFSSNTASKSLGTNSMEALRLLAYYSNENTSIILYNPGKEDIHSVELFNIIGQSTYRLDSVGAKKYSAFKTKNLNEGIYILNIKMDNGHMLSKKVLVKN